MVIKIRLLDLSNGKPSFIIFLTLELTAITFLAFIVAFLLIPRGIGKLHISSCERLKF